MSKKIKKDRLHAIFAQVKSESPSMSFEYNLMQRIRAEQVVAKRRRNKLALLSMILGVLGVVILPSVVLHLLGWSVLDVFGNTEVSLADVFRSFKVGSSTIAISLVSLFLLMTDTLVRRYFNKKEKK